MVRLRRRWVTRRCASADGEKDEKDENISGGSMARTQSAICRPPTIVIERTGAIAVLGRAQPNYLGRCGSTGSARTAQQGKNGDAPYASKGAVDNLG